MTDPFLVLGTTVALLGVVRIAGMSVAQWMAHDAPISGIVTLVVGLTIAALAKGPIGLVFGALPVTGLLLSAEGRRRFLRFPFMSVVVGFCILGLPWFALAEARTPGFLEYFIVGEHVRRFLDPTWSGDLYGGTHPKPHGIVWLYFALAILPWIPAGFVSARAAGWPRLRAMLFREPMVGVLLMSVLPPLVLFTLAGSLLPTYVYPSVPAACVLIAAGIQRRGEVSRTTVVSREKIPVTLAVLGVPLLLVLGLLPPSFWIGSSQRDLLRDVEASEIVYARSIETMYSADFYSGGRAREAADASDPIWDRVREHPRGVAVVTKERDLHRIPPDVQQRLQLARDMGARYQLWRVEPWCGRHPEGTLAGGSRR